MRFHLSLPVCARPLSTSSPPPSTRASEGSPWGGRCSQSPGKGKTAPQTYPKHHLHFSPVSFGPRGTVSLLNPLFESVANCLPEGPIAFSLISDSKEYRSKFTEAASTRGIEVILEVCFTGPSGAMEAESPSTALHWNAAPYGLSRTRYQCVTGSAAGTQGWGLAGLTFLRVAS